MEGKTVEGGHPLAVPVLQDLPPCCVAESLERPVRVVPVGDAVVGVASVCLGPAIGMADG